MITKEQKKEIYSKLPEALKEKISSLENIEKVETIAKKFSLNENQKDILDSEILLLMMGIRNKDDFLRNISEKIGVDQIKALELYNEVYSIILEEIKDLIPKNMFAETAGPTTPNQESLAQTPNNLDILSKQEETPIPVKPLPNTAPFPEDKTVPMVEERKWWEQPQGLSVAGDYNIPNQERPKEVANQETSAPIKPEETATALQKEVSSQVPEIAPEMEIAIKKETSREETKPSNQSEITPPKIIGLASEPVQVTPTIPAPPTGSQPSQVAPSQSPSFFEKIVPNTNPTQPTQAPKSVVDATLSNLAEDEEEWMKRKNAFANQGNQDRVLRTQYPTGQDPYREPLS